MERLIFHIDVNSAFLSWESARRVKQGLQDLRDIPACIGGDPKKRTGIVVAKSIPAKNMEYRQVNRWQWPFENVRSLLLSKAILNFISNVPGRLKKSVHRMRL